MAFFVAPVSLLFIRYDTNVPKEPKIISPLALCHPSDSPSTHFFTAVDGVLGACTHKTNCLSSAAKKKKKKRNCHYIQEQANTNIGTQLFLSSNILCSMFFCKPVWHQILLHLTVVALKIFVVWKSLLAKLEKNCQKRLSVLFYFF